ncbi:MAG: hypothetical protein EZS28_022550 [Streblomastix strix]|uniref:Uncharacterized protein n=1 Tax=Streblomastix strix TaxID=222440 RepID=A0A5J4VI26_9EUKA|nr:MAG: hypothetical protein EZS28_022550 [Streblomastix strix]
MYDQNWCNNRNIVPDQVTPANDATPFSEGSATAGIRTEQSRNDHVHHPNVTITLPQRDILVGNVGSASTYARSDNQHPINIETNVSIMPIVNGVDDYGSSVFYARNVHVHLQQLANDGNVIATKFIQTGGLATETLYANSDTKAIYDNDIQETDQQILLEDGSTTTLASSQKEFYIMGTTY